MGTMDCKPDGSGYSECQGCPCSGYPAEAVFQEGVFIQSNTLQLPNLAGKRCITSGFVMLQSTLANLDGLGLDSLEVIVGSISIQGNSALSSITALGLHLTSVGGGIRIQGNAALTNISFPLLTAVNEIGQGQGQMGLQIFGPASISFPSLTSVNRCIVIGGLAVTSLDFPVLTSVTGGGGEFGLAISSTSLTGIGFPRLASVTAPTVGSGGGIHLYLNEMLTNVSFPALTTVSATGVGGFIVEAKGSVYLPALTTVTGGNAGLAISGATSLDLSALTSVTGGNALNINSGLRIFGTALTNLTLPRLVSVTGGQLGGLQIGHNAALTSISCPALTSVSAAAPVDTNAAGLMVSDNAALTTIGLPVLRFADGGISINNNPNLSNCTVQALTQQTGAACSCAGNGSGC